jgi:glucokinase
VANKTIKNAGAVQVVADIGGTNARFAFVEAGSNQLQGIEISPCAKYPFFIDAIQAYMQRGHFDSVESICLAVAGPVDKPVIDLPNNHWVFNRDELQQSLGLPVSIINDFSAQVLSIEGLEASELHWVGKQRPNPESTQQVKAVLGPGTGLGVSAMMPSGDILPSEGGHIAFAPNSDHESALLKELWTRYERVSVERVLSGMGLSNLYWANSRLDGLERELPPQEVTAGARAGDIHCVAAVKDFCAILGSVAGDIALMVGATNGVYISGGIMPKMLDIFDEDKFRQRFNNKGRFSDMCADIPTAIVLAEQPGLQGCVQALRKGL